jgi:formate hydrogenlyase subunit 3/multisubunit Na+/H+ antiporter MnhD subunit
VGRIFMGTRAEGTTADPLPWAMVAPTVLLAALALISGIFPAPVFHWVDQALELILGGNW